jgi:hypothetical protein
MRVCDCNIPRASADLNKAHLFSPNRQVYARSQSEEAGEARKEFLQQKPYCALQFVTPIPPRAKKKKTSAKTKTVIQTKGKSQHVYKIEQLQVEVPVRLQYRV